MDRATLYYQMIGRAYDGLRSQKYALEALGQAMWDALYGGTAFPQAVVGGFAASAASPASLQVNLAPGSIYQQTGVDLTNWSVLTGVPAGDLMPTDSTQVIQQGVAAAQTVTISTAALSTNQNQYALIEVGFTQVDDVPSDDVSDGFLNYVNVSNPTSPNPGPPPSGVRTFQNTRRKGVANVRVAYGPAATLGAAVPPGVDAGYVPLYLILLSFGQTQILQNQILVAGPNTYPGYQPAPFLAGQTKQHHLGTEPGQGPQIDLTLEVKNILPLTNLPATGTISGSLLPTIRAVSGNPNGQLAGSFMDEAFDTTTGLIWICKIAGPATGALAAVWASATGVAPPFANSLLQGPLVDLLTAGTGIALSTQNPTGMNAVQVSTSNVPNGVLAGPLNGGVTAGPGVVVTALSASGVSTQTVTATDYGHSYGNPGWENLLGTIVQQGSQNFANKNAGDTISVSFPTTFPHACLEVIATPDQGVPGTWITLQQSARSTTGASWVANLGLNNQTFVVRYIAVGW